jgi:hypothetical protein
VTRRLLSALLLLVVLAIAPRTSRAAEIQKSGPEVFPGKFAVGVYPLGVQVAFDGRSTGGYKFLADFAGVLASPGKMTLWLGGELYYAHPSYSCQLSGSGCGHDIGFGLLFRITLEKLMKIPLVPYVQAGLAGDILVWDSSNIGGGLPIRVGGGLHYYILKNVGLGVYTNFAFGFGAYPATKTGFCGAGASSCTGFLGNWDFGMGATFAF